MRHMGKRGCVGELKSRLQDLLEERRELILVEWREAAQEDVQDDADRPHVDCAGAVALVAQNLGRNVAGRAARGAHDVLARDDARQAEVGNLREVRGGMGSRNGAGGGMMCFYLNFV